MLTLLIHKYITSFIQIQFYLRVIYILLNLHQCLFLVTVNAIIFLILVSTYLSLVHRNTKDIYFFKFILYPLTQLNLHVSSKSQGFGFLSFFVDFLEFSIWTTLTPAKKDIFISSFLICVSFISFSYLSRVSRSSSRILKKRTEFISLSYSQSQGEAFRI